MSLAKIARRMTLRGIVLIIILFVVTINAAHASDPGRWVYDLFRSSVHVEYYSDDGSGIAVGPEGETIEFCVKGEPCDVSIRTHHRRTHLHPPQLYMPAISTDIPTITVTRRRPLANHYSSYRISWETRGCGLFRVPWTWFPWPPYAAPTGTVGAALPAGAGAPAPLP